ncbi:Aspartyl/glutamyl-tRNA(Asn/Gln) amidotransferase subunit C [Phytophthora nicotianae]|uniref:diacylglycerol O-acyltransferase n=1 Tax=Phytophthora nicotianae TaxID=4792 RepID=A0A0W8DNC1_PHYNI|nr:Aspartyl/glutamyl-tRNA(Asn/Gln) amidotransferase subunit C [Phytophthora nicotianae]
MTGLQQTWLLGVGLAVATTSACIAIHASALVTIATACVAAYLPSYLDGSEYTGERYWPWFATFIGHGMAHIPGTLEFEEPIDASKQHIFCSHPHGLLSTHHGLLMSGQTVPRVTVNQVFGKSIPIEKKDDPSTEDIEKLHDQYEHELVRIFDKYKAKYGYGNCTLRVR